MLLHCSIHWFLEFSVGVKGFCHRSESNLFLVLLQCKFSKMRQEDSRPKSGTSLHIHTIVTYITVSYLIMHQLVHS